MIRRYKHIDKKSYWYDIHGIGHEGSIRGLTRDQLCTIKNDIEQELMGEGWNKQYQKDKRARDESAKINRREVA